MRYLKPHSKKCELTLKNEMWTFVHELPYWGNAYGNPNARRGGHHYFVKLRCNDPKCKALIVVDDFDVTQAILKFREE